MQKYRRQNLNFQKKVNCISQSEGRIVAASDDNDVYFFIEDIQNVQKLISKNVSEIKFYDEKNTIFTAMTEKGEYSVWKIIEDENKNLTCEIIFSADCSVKGESIEKLSFTADTSYIALGLSDNSIRLHYRLRFTNSAITKIFPSKNSKITSLNFSDKNNFLISTYANGELFLWDCITGKEIAHINNLEPKNFFPSFFNEETKTIIKFNRKNELCFYDLSGKVIFKQKIEKSIKTITSPTKSGEVCCITDKNEIILIDINTGKITGQAEHSETKKITAVSYHENNSVVFAGFEDGSIKKLDVLPYMASSFSTSSVENKNTEPSSMQEREGTFFQKQTGFNSISFCAGGTLLNSPFSYAVNARAEYLTSTVFPPFYFGIGATAQLGFPKKDFPYEYKINNTDANPPNLASGILYFPFGVEFSPWNNKVFVKTGFRTGLMITTLAFISGNSYFTGKPAPAFFVEYNAGIIFNFFELEFSCSYNTLGNINQSVYAGYVLRW